MVKTIHIAVIIATVGLAAVSQATETTPQTNYEWVFDQCAKTLSQFFGPLESEIVQADINDLAGPRETPLTLHVPDALARENGLRPPIFLSRDGMRTQGLDMPPDRRASDTLVRKLLMQTLKAEWGKLDRDGASMKKLREARMERLHREWAEKYVDLLNKKTGKTRRPVVHKQDPKMPTHAEMAFKENLDKVGYRHDATQLDLGEETLARVAGDTCYANTELLSKEQPDKLLFDEMTRVINKKRARLKLESEWKAGDSALPPSGSLTSTPSTESGAPARDTR